MKGVSRKENCGIASVKGEVGGGGMKHMYKTGNLFIDF